MVDTNDPIAFPFYHRARAILFGDEPYKRERLDALFVDWKKQMFLMWADDEFLQLSFDAMLEDVVGERFPGEDDNVAQTGSA